MLLFHKACLFISLCLCSIHTLAQSFHGDTVSRNILFEEFTGTWCGWCPGGHLILDNILDSNPNVIPVVIHGGKGAEPMRTDFGDQLVKDLLIWFPSASIDRLTFPDNNVTQIGSAIWAEKLQARQKHPPKAKVSIDRYYESLSNSVSLTVTVEFLTVIKGDFRFNGYIIEDNVAGGSSYDQTNYYNNKPDYPDLFNKGNPIKGYVHHHVLREMMGGPFGLNPAGELAIPNKVDPGQIFSHTFSSTLDERYKPEDIQLVGYVMRYGDFHDTEVLNAASTPLIETSVSEIAIPNEFVVYPNPSYGRLNISIDSKQTKEMLITITDLHSCNVYSKKFYPIIGSQIISLDLTSLELGIYILELEQGVVHESQKVFVRNP